MNSWRDSYSQCPTRRPLVFQLKISFFVRNSFSAHEVRISFMCGMRIRKVISVAFVTTHHSPNRISVFAARKHFHSPQRSIYFSGQSIIGKQKARRTINQFNIFSRVHAISRPHAEFSHFDGEPNARSKSKMTKAKWKHSTKIRETSVVCARVCPVGGWLILRNQ